MFVELRRKFQKILSKLWLKFREILCKISGNFKEILKEHNILGAKSALSRELFTILRKVNVRGLFPKKENLFPGTTVSPANRDGVEH